MNKINWYLKMTFILVLINGNFVAVISLEESVEKDNAEEAEEEKFDFSGMVVEPGPEDLQLTIQLEKELRNDSKMECTAKDDNDYEEEDREGGAQQTISTIKINRKLKWQDFNVYIHPSYNYRDRTLITTAMSRLNTILKPCGMIRFGIFRPNVKPVGDYIHIFQGNGCWSLIGRVGGGRQRISLESPGCMRTETILHELIHSLGLFHEQNRPDRDEHIKILWQNIPVHTRMQFGKRSFRESSSFGLDYDQNSIMHYGSTAFSKNGLPTIVAKNGKSVGPVGDLTPTDIQKLKKMYC